MEKCATEKRVLEAKKLISCKARDMLRHYVSRILPDGFKSQVVATSRVAAVRYQNALEEARDELVGELEALDPTLLTLDDDAVDALDADAQLLVRAHRHLPRILALEFAAVISHDHNDAPSWRQWSDKTCHEEYERKFKLPFEHKDPEKRSNLAFLCVQNMLLTGFDAPIEQVMYLDRRIYEHELLQAIARVNRKRDGKNCGYVVDYVGVAQAIHDALQGIDDETIDGAAIQNVRDEIPKLESRHARVIEVFTSRGIANVRDVEACVDLLEDVEIRAEFINKFRDFLVSLGIVMPRPEALPYLRDAKILGFIAKVAANLYRDQQLNLLGVEIKVRQLIDQYIEAHGVNPRIPPIEITDVGFEEHVRKRRSSRTRASEMLHALRHHIHIRINEDPEFFNTMSEKLEKILQTLKDNWDELERALIQFIREEVARGRQAEIPGLDPKLQAPFFGVLKQRLDTELGTAVDSASPEFAALVQLTVDLVERIREEIRRVDFWRDDVSRGSLETWVYNTVRRRRVDGEKLLDVPDIRELATRLVDLARHRHRWLVQ
jgi:type I restriction enzyme R subunit